MLKPLFNILWETVVRLGIVVGLLAGLAGILAGTSDFNVYHAVTVLNESRIDVRLDPALELGFELRPHLHKEWHDLLASVKEYNVTP